MAACGVAPLEALVKWVLLGMPPGGVGATWRGWHLGAGTDHGMISGRGRMGIGTGAVESPDLALMYTLEAA